MQTTTKRQYLLDDRELDIIAAALGKMPFESVHMVVRTIQDQYTAQALGKTIEAMNESTKTNDEK